MGELIEPKLAGLTPVPGKLLYPDDNTKADAYDKLATDEERIKKGGKWWSMYQLMKHFHSGILPEHSDSNYFEFEIDFTSPHLRVATINDPNMVQEVNSTMMTGLQSLAGKIQGLIGKLQVEASTNALKISQDAMNRPRTGGKKNSRRLKGGEPPAAAGMPGAAPLDTAGEIAALLNPAGLEAECFKDLFRVKLNTWDRIFITNAKDNKLPLSNLLNLPKEGAVADKVEAEVAGLAAGPAIGVALAAAPMAAAAAGGGKRYRTRKARKHGKKNKTQHRRRRQPSRK